MKRKSLLILLFLNLFVICSPLCVAVNASEKDTSFTVLYYANVEQYSVSGKTEIPVINTLGGVLPNNYSTPNLMNVYLDDDGYIETETVLKQLFSSKNFFLEEVSSVSYIDCVSSYGNYVLDKVQVKNGDEWIDYGTDVSFTDNANDASSKKIYVDNDTVIRLVYTPTVSIYNNGVTFFDYDVSDGNAYSDSTYTTLADRNSSSLIYINTNQQGINNSANYLVDGAKFAFGNNNIDSNLGTSQWNGVYLNQYNSSVYRGAVFGVANTVETSEDEFDIVFSDGISAPNLFGSESAIGKTEIDNWSLNFERNGDTYTLVSVLNDESDVVLDNLNVFSNPDENYPSIWSNNFWPMDAASTYNAEGHDIAFGSTLLKKSRLYGSGSKYLPVSDDGLDHNSYFGLKYKVTFYISEDYVGPLDYLFIGDDDLWVFLDDQLIGDIGGVHPSVGEYVNLWDYLDEGVAGEHTIYFFYTERGASGSTLFTQFTLPCVNYSYVETLDTEDSDIVDNPLTSDSIVVLLGILSFSLVFIVVLISKVSLVKK